jgi:hypothetical protein
MLFRADSRRCCRPHYGVRVLRSVKLLEMIVLTRRKKKIDQTVRPVARSLRGWRGVTRSQRATEASRISEMSSPQLVKRLQSSHGTENPTRARG